jgi:hypothetical protein
VLVDENDNSAARMADYYARFIHDAHLDPSRIKSVQEYAIWQQICVSFVYGAHVCAAGFEQRLRDTLDGGALGDPSSMDGLVNAGTIFIVGTGFAATGGVIQAQTAGTADSEGGSVTVYRNVDGREFDDIATNGKWRTGFGMMEGKWFALRGEHADKWGEMMNGVQGFTLEQEIPRSLFDKLHLHPDKLDGIGPGVYAQSEQMEDMNKLGSGIKIWGGAGAAGGGE